MTTWFSGTAVVRAITAQWHLSAGAAAGLTIAVQLGFVAGALISAIVNLLDVVSPRRVFVIAACGAAAFNAAFAFAPGGGAAFALRLLTGFCLAGVYPTGLKLMATWFRRGRGRALGIMIGALTLGSAAPHLVNGLGGLPWRTVVLTTSALTLIGAAIAGVMFHEGPFPFPRAKFDATQAGRVLRDSGVRLACIGYFGHMWELYAMWAWFLVFFADRLERAGASHARETASLATFAVISAGFAGSWWLGSLADRWGRARSAALAMAISAACAIAIGPLSVAPVWLVLAIGLVWGASVVADSAQFSTLVTELADPAYVGTALTLQLGIGFALTAATIWLVPLLRDAVGWRWAFMFLAPGPVVGMLAMARLRAVTGEPLVTRATAACSPRPAKSPTHRRRG